MGMYFNWKSGRVRYDKPLLTCICPHYNKESKEYLRGGAMHRKPSAPFCEHMREMLRARLDTLPVDVGTISVHVTRIPNLSMQVEITVTDDPDLISCSLPVFYDDGKLFTEHDLIFLGYLPKTSSRSDIRDLILPVLADKYFTMACPRCNMHPSHIKRDNLHAEPESGKPLTKAAYHAGYMLRFGCCDACNNDDLIPNASPNPPEPIVMGPGWPVSMGIGKKPRTKPPSWASGGVIGSPAYTSSGGASKASGSFTTTTPSILYAGESDGTWNPIGHCNICADNFTWTVNES